MTSAPSKTTTVRTVNNKTGVTKSTSTTTTGNSTTVTKTTTIGTPAKTTPAASVSTPATLPGAVLGSKWIAGPNDSRQLCVPVAVANALLGLRDGDHLRVRRRVLELLHLVERAGDDLRRRAFAGPHDHGANRHLLRLTGLRRQPQGLPHVELVVMFANHAPTVKAAARTRKPIQHHARPGCRRTS